ncbi:AAA family ATPase [Aerococcaceae bacterium zg-B36]|uniref:AAA family ATPase n=1 Tax=Aerococcaceae bacterium zg-252 TaxID=2796928 RepID=UPI001BD84230|nr:AAA family ATPase [Aerococcaceae bacterium zg-B36]
MAFKKAEEIRMGAKFLNYGGTGSGKSTFALSFPKIAAIDSEAGLSFYVGTEKGKNVEMISQTQDFKELSDDLAAIMDSKPGEIQTLVIDSMTKIKENVEEVIMTVEEKKNKAKGKVAEEVSISQRAWGRVKYENGRIQNRQIDISSKGIHVVAIAQAKEKTRMVGDQMIVEGIIPDMKKQSAYDYDVVLYSFTETDSNGETKFLARVEKDRLGVFKIGDVIENASYEHWKDVLEKNSKNKVSEINFSKDVESGMKAYEQERDEEVKSIKERITQLITELSDEHKERLKSDLKSARISGFDSLTVKQEEKVNELIEKYKEYI